MEGALLQMMQKNVTPSKIINAGFEQYLKTHSDYSVLEVLQEREHDKLRILASGFALKEYLSETIKVKDISYEIDNGSLVFKKHNLKVCTLGPEVTNSMYLTYLDNKVKVYRGNKSIYSTIDDREEPEKLLLRVHSITLLFCYNSIVNGIEKLGLSNDKNTKQIAFLA